MLQVDIGVAVTAFVNAKVEEGARPADVEAADVLVLKLVGGTASLPGELFEPYSKAKSPSYKIGRAHV